jgi:hypothetical protein
MAKITSVGAKTMGRGRPAKSIEYHRVTNTYRPGRHGERPVTPPKPEALSADADAWESTLQLGEDFFSDLDLTAVQISRRARAKWREHGVALMRHWGEERTREAWALLKFGPPCESRRGRNGA